MLKCDSYPFIGPCEPGAEYKHSKKGTGNTAHETL